MLAVEKICSCIERKFNMEKVKVPDMTIMEENVVNNLIL
jgi:hypothetical protein